MPNAETDQPPQEPEISPADVLAVQLLFKRIAERGHRIRMEREATERQKAGEKPMEEGKNER
jgi:hypothetical protein